jgi:hypothetical protein
MCICFYIINEYKNSLLTILKTKEYICLYKKYINSSKDCIYNNILNIINERLKTNKINNLDIYDSLDIIIKNEIMILIEKILKMDEFQNFYKKNEFKKIDDYINDKINTDIKTCYCEDKYLKNTICLIGKSIFANISLIQSLNYYWNNYSTEFKRFPIFDIGLLDWTEYYLNIFYNLGYRNFIGFTSSNDILDTRKWFNLHPDAIGISPTNPSSSLDIPKNIYCLQPLSNNIINSILPEIQSARTVYYIYSEQFATCLDYLLLLKNITPKIELKSLPTTIQTITIDRVKLFLKDSNENDILILCIESGRPFYINLFLEGLEFNGQQYDILSGQEPIIPSGIINEKLSNNYNLVLYSGIGTSILWRRGYIDIGEQYYSSTSLNILNMLNTITANQYIQNINSHFSILEFNDITKNLTSSSVLLKKYSNNKFITTKLTGSDELLGTYTAFFENEVLLEKPKLNNLKITGKPIALLELTKSPIDIDQILNDSLYFYWNQDNTLPKFPIIDTGSTITNTLKLLDIYYNKGYRIFLGFSRSTILAGVNNWFKDHPDTVGFSATSRSSLIIKSSNLYQLNYTEELLIKSLIPELENSETLYYIYTEGELLALEYLFYLENNPKINLKTLVIKRDGSNLTLPVLTEFLNGSTSNDITLIVLFNVQQKYFDLYNEGLFFGGLQYYTFGGLPQLTGESQTILDNKLINVQPFFPNTSLLYRKNIEFLTKRYKNFQQSFGILHALRIFKNLLDKKSISLLGADNGILEFNEKNSIKYDSLLLLIYKKDVNNFVKYKIEFDDPLLGAFFADLV